MVFCFLISSLVDASTPLLFSSFYSKEGNDEYKSKREEYLTRRIQEEYRSRKATDLHLLNESSETGTSSTRLNKIFLRLSKFFRTRSEEGAFRIQKGINYRESIEREVTLFYNTKLVLWKQIGR
jgi:hypothetical protein